MSINPLSTDADVHVDTTWSYSFMQLFTTITSFVGSALILVVYFRIKNPEKIFLVIECITTIVFSIFWLALAILTSVDLASTVHWPELEGIACEAVDALRIGPKDYCKAYVRRFSLIGLCAVSWISCGCWSFSSYISIQLDVRQKRVFDCLFTKFRNTSGSNSINIFSETPVSVSRAFALENNTHSTGGIKYRKTVGLILKNYLYSMNLKEPSFSDDCGNMEEGKDLSSLASPSSSITTTTDGFGKQIPEPDWQAPCLTFTFFL